MPAQQRLPWEDRRPSFAPLVLAASLAGAWWWWWSQRRNKNRGRPGGGGARAGGAGAGIRGPSGAVSSQFDGNSQSWVQKKTSFTNHKGKVVMQQQIVTQGAKHRSPPPSGTGSKRKAK